MVVVAVTSDLDGSLGLDDGFLGPTGEPQAARLDPGESCPLGRHRHTSGLAPARVEHCERFLRPAALAQDFGQETVTGAAALELVRLSRHQLPHHRLGAVQLVVTGRHVSQLSLSYGEQQTVRDIVQLPADLVEIADPLGGGKRGFELLVRPLVVEERNAEDPEPIVYLHPQPIVLDRLERQQTPRRQVGGHRQLTHSRGVRGGPTGGVDSQIPLARAFEQPQRFSGVVVDRGGSPLVG